MAEIGPEIGESAGFVVDDASTTLWLVAEAGSPPSNSHGRSGRGTLLTGPVGACEDTVVKAEVSVHASRGAAGLDARVNGRTCVNAGHV